ncbi:hypothetical protein OR16_15324 [Cupriavidus basilensis OR16]|uniref:Uncharacterized protein n=1 Tax=Cupriavidus basilensis OR16 TaxID=1127483 RepID=H1S5E5_9BURK|nr:hypothetical protein [Cupriavidus basilensis]EHP42312.1 hypothetical protein OR16_15324 [Cupriavidus basilensis OR16]
MERSFKKNTTNTANYMRNTASPRSYMRYFNRVVFAHNYVQVHVALFDLVPRLLRRGQSPETVANDLAQLASINGFHDCVATVVNELAMRGAA